MSDEPIDLNTIVAKQLKRQRPKDTDGSGTFDVSISSEDILSKVEFVLQTEIEAFDAACGGLPFGRIVEMYGLEACGKTNMCIRSLIKAQLGRIYRRTVVDNVVKLVLMDPTKIGVTTVFIDNEQSVDEDQKIVIEGTTLDCVLVRCDTVDQIFKISDIVIEKITEKQEAENKAAKDEKRDPITFFVVLVVDTIAGTSSKQEMTKDWNKEDFQRQPKMLSEGFRRMQRSINRHNVLMICTNQVREAFKTSAPGQRKIHYSTPQNDDFSTFGGRALKFYASLRIFMFRLNENYRLSGAKFSQGYLIGFRTQKNRQLKPLREGRLVLLFGGDGVEGGMNNLYSKLETMSFLGIAKWSPATKKLTLQFSKFGIETETFAAAPSKKSAGRSLEEADDRGRSSSDPDVAKKDWPQFYLEHKVDCDKLWEIAPKVMFSDNPVGEEIADDDTIDMDDDN